MGAKGEELERERERERAPCVEVKDWGVGELKS